MSHFHADLLKGRVALVTGGGTGICRGIALAFAAHGCDVAIVSRKMEHLEPTLAELRGHGVRAIAHAADVRDPAAVDAAVAAIVAGLGRKCARKLSAGSDGDDRRHRQRIALSLFGGRCVRQWRDARRRRWTVASVRADTG